MRINIGLLLLAISIIGVISFNILKWDKTIFYFLFGMSIWFFDKWIGKKKK